MQKIENEKRLSIIITTFFLKITVRGIKNDFMNTKNIFITGNNSLIRQALKNMIKEEANLTCIGEAESGINLLDQIITQPDLFLIDLDMPYLTTPLQIINQLGHHYPSLRIATLSDQPDKPLLIHSTKMGSTISGYILKSDPCPTIRKAIKIMAQGGQYCSPKIIKIMLENMRQASKPTLSKRETQVLALISKTNHEIAEQLSINVSAVRTHIKRIKCKLLVKKREELVKLVL